MEKIRFISESAKIDDIPEGNGRLFIFPLEATLLSQLTSKLGIDLSEKDDAKIPEGTSVFRNNEVELTIVNVLGEGMICFPENEHKGIG